MKRTGMPGVEDRKLCPLCLSGDIGRALFRHERPDKYEAAIGVGAEGYWRETRICGACGSLVQVGGSGRIEDVYGRAYRARGVVRDEPQESLFRRISGLPREESENLARIDALAHDLRPLLNLEAPVRMLDIGSGLGVFPWGMALRFPRWRVAAVDPDSSSCALLRREATAAGVSIATKASRYRPGFFRRRVAFADGRFDLVTLLHVLEHIRDADELLDGLRADMADGGLLYIEAPDALSAHLCGEGHDRFNSCHYFLPSERGLSQLLGRHGLEVAVARRARTKRGMVNLCCVAACPVRVAGAAPRGGG